MANINAKESFFWKKPGVTTKIDTKQVDIDQDPQGNVEIKAKNNSNNN